jgi:hypothetical protein
MAYLRCPNCRLTVFDRNPLASARRCPRCSVRGNLDAQLERVLQLRGGDAGSILSAPSRQPER